MVERAVRTLCIENIESASSEYGRVYFGAEFCERALPSREELEKALDRAAARGLSFTLMTPFLTARGMERVKALLQAMASRGDSSAHEVVCNDWGTLEVLRREHGSLVPVAGRLLNKQARDPRLEAVAESHRALGENARLSALDRRSVEGFLRLSGVTRLEFDNLPQGIRRGGSLAATLYHPFVFVSTGRLCPHIQRSGVPFARAMGTCARQCSDVLYHVHYKVMNREVIARGCTQFYRYDAPLVDGAAPGVDRILHFPEVAW